VRDPPRIGSENGHHSWSFFHVPPFACSLVEESRALHKGASFPARSGGARVLDRQNSLWCRVPFNGGYSSWNNGVCVGIGTALPRSRFMQEKAGGSQLKQVPSFIAERA
jgi:hypothetical protein